MEERERRKNVKVVYNHTNLGNKTQPGESRESREGVSLTTFGRHRGTIHTFGKRIVATWPSPPLRNHALQPPELDNIHRKVTTTYDGAVPPPRSVAA